MTEGNVASKVACPDPTNVRSGKPVTGPDQWFRLAHAANYLNSSEVSLIASFHPEGAITEALGFAARIWQRYQNRRRLWIVVYRGRSLETDEVVNCYGHVHVNGPTAIPYTTHGESISYGFYLEDQVQSATPEDVTIVFEPGSASDDLYIEQISCYEVRRFALDPSNATEDTADITSCKRGSVIYADTNHSIAGAVNGILSARSNCRRASLFHWSAPISSATGSPILVGQNSVWSNLFTLQPEVLARCIYAASATVRVCIYAARTAYGTVGRIRATAESGDVQTAEITGGSSWYTLDLSIETESLSNSYGHRGDTETITFEVYGDATEVEGEEVYSIELGVISVGEIT